MGEKDHDWEREYSPNPEYNRPIREYPKAERARLFRQQCIAGSLDTYYQMYPLDRPPTRDPNERGRVR